MSTTTRYDAHCHIFTLRYVLKELKSMLYDMYYKQYPWPKSEGFRAEQIEMQGIADIKEVSRWLLELTSAALTTERRNLNFLQRQARKAFPGDRHSIIPLMMDVYFFFAYSLGEDEDYPVAFRTSSEISHRDDFRVLWHEVLDMLKNQIVHLGWSDQEEGMDARIKALGEKLSILEQERGFVESVPEMPKNLVKTKSVDYYHTEGFDFHLKNLMKLVRYRRGELYPFIAVDPRRNGMIETVKSGRFFESTPRFYGVKLYPRLGYHPMCKPLMPLYEYCAQKGIPITFHCGMSGFPPGIRWRYAEYGNPANFEPIVKQYPDLRINFAHMGSNDPTNQWEETILRLVNENPNVYTDLSCYTNLLELKSMRKYWDQNPALQQRLMYGTDFDVMYFSGTKITMQEYMQNFKAVFPDALQRMMIDNPKSFLGVEEKWLTLIQKILLRLLR